MALLPGPGDVAEGDLCCDDQAGQAVEHRQERSHSHLQADQSSDNDWPGPLVSDNIYTAPPHFTSGNTKEGKPTYSHL